MLVASKQRDATEAGQVAGQMLLVMLAAAAKTHYDPVYEREQRIRVSLTTRPTPDHIRGSTQARGIHSRLST